MGGSIAKIQKLPESEVKGTNHSDLYLGDIVTIANIRESDDREIATVTCTVRSLKNPSDAPRKMRSSYLKLIACGLASACDTLSCQKRCNINLVKVLRHDLEPKTRKKLLKTLGDRLQKMYEINEAKFKLEKKEHIHTVIQSIINKNEKSSTLETFVDYFHTFCDWYVYEEDQLKDLIIYNYHKNIEEKGIGYNKCYGGNPLTEMPEAKPLEIKIHETAIGPKMHFTVATKKHNAHEWVEEQFDMNNSYAGIWTCEKYEGVVNLLVLKRTDKWSPKVTRKFEIHGNFRGQGLDKLYDQFKRCNIRSD